MSIHGPSAFRLFAAATAGTALLVIGLPVAAAAPTSDSRGYVDSTARCAAPSSVVVFGRTASSRVAICESADGEYEYRGVRVRDGAKLIAPASPADDGGFTAENDGITYTVTADALTITSGNRVIREEAMVDFHGSAPAGNPGASPQAPAATPTPTTPLPPPLPAEVGGGSSSS
ncbi:hypothetical protein [Mycolicibacterium holsaticum]|uniref:hypothetical protein n=1 Tax=Mycolicibacterium holsaticum TaxID=152142 RepID=UPI001C7D9F68|nr:hypothetical protein [Mycolicibacterium holsaticum]QZA13975.1 hypothetical protein K3U96_07595 [Mycolicibacterium holsaticum DSM 44478 = JCM 12374]UNC08565.1 hypothetical protein H5U41_19235 [Mycolicibacterium holsaticum DSM 44478 = JCM 12374]